LHTLGVGEKIENIVSESVPIYEKIACCAEREDIWDQPDVGLLGGRITNISDQNSFDLRDFDGMVWSVQEDEETIEYEPLKIVAGEQVKIIGEKRGENIFWAREIRPWRNRGDAHKAKKRFDPQIP
jgi:hypothetical protein